MDNLDNKLSEIKLKIQKLIERNNLDDANILTDNYMKKIPNDAEIYSIKAVIFLMQGSLDEAERVLKEGLAVDSENFDLNYNLGYLYEKKKELNEAIKYYKKAMSNCKDEKLKVELSSFVEKICSENNIEFIENKKKIVFFVKQGMDSFLGDIIDGLSDDYETKKIIVTDYKQIDEGMGWADICWFEWCDELVAYGSKNILAKEKKMICRLHSYEGFTDYPSKVNWDNVDKLIFIGEHIRSFVIDKFKISRVKTEIISNGLDLSKYTFKERKPGFNIAYVGYINYKKGPMLLLHTFKAIYDKDKRYKLYIAGQFQDDRDVLYFKQMIKEFGIEKNVFYEGWQDDLDKWLEDKNYILCTSLLESQNISVMEAMVKGIKPIIHNFVGCKSIYKKKYVWNSISDAVNMITDKEYDSNEYKKFIENKYSLEEQMKKIKEVIKNLSKADKAEKKHNESLTLEYINEKFSEFIPYSNKDFNVYDFLSAQIYLGKREKVSEDTELIEFILNNKNNKKIIINNVWYNVKDKFFILPQQIANSKNKQIIIGFIQNILKYDEKFQNNIAGYIFDKDVIEDVNKNSLAYNWERAMPASQFMPLKGYLLIAERYLFAAKFIDKHSKVLEAPCGFGYGAAYFSKLAKTVDTIDLAEENIEFGKSAYDFHNINWSIGDVTKLKYKNEEFDVYVSYEVFEHLPIELVDEYLKEARRVIKTGGKFIISTPNREMRKHINNPFHIKEYSFHEFSNLLKKYFNNIEYYSVTNFKVEKGMCDSAFNMIAVCEN